MPGKPTEIAQSRRPVFVELERVDRGDAEQFALDEPAFDLAPLGEGVAGPVGESRAAVSASSRSLAKRWMSSVALQLLAKQIVRRPRETSSARRRALAERARPELQGLVHDG